jgi:hypothetical protein
VSVLLTLGKAALAVPCQEWQLRRLADAKLVPCNLAGSYRVFSRSDLPAIRAAAREKGYLPKSKRVTADAP